MGTDPSDRAGSAALRFRAPVSRARSWLAGLGLTGRLVLAAASLTALLLFIQVVHRQGAAPTTALYGGHHFPAEETQRILRALEAKSIAARSSGGRIEVSLAHAAEAHAVVEKAGLAPRSSRSLLDTPLSPSLLASQSEIEAAQWRRREQILEAEIHEIDPGISATVILRPKRGRGLAAEETLRATVKLVAERGQPVSPSLVEAVLTKVLAFEPDLSAESLRVVDASGHAYLLPGKPELIEQSTLRAREEELEGLILENLAWIQGVRVEVQIVAGETATILEPEATPLVAVNAPLDGDADSEPESNVTPSVHVVVRVPSSYYRRHYDEIRAAAEPSPGDLIAFERKTTESIRSAVAMAVPPGEVGEIEVDRIFPTEPAAVVTTPVAPRPAAQYGEVAVAVGVGLGLLGLAAVGRRWRGPAPRSASARSGRISRRVDRSGDPVASAHELIRLDPAAAAGVLHRWLGHAAEERGHDHHPHGA